HSFPTRRSPDLVQKAPTGSLQLCALLVIDADAKSAFLNTEAQIRAPVFFRPSYSLGGQATLEDCAAAVDVVSAGVSHSYFSFLVYVSTTHRRKSPGAAFLLRGAGGERGSRSPGVP